VGKPVLEHPAVYFTGGYVARKLTDENRWNQGYPMCEIEDPAEIIFFNDDGVNRTNAHAFTAIYASFCNQTRLASLNPEGFGGAGLDAVRTAHAYILLYLQCMMKRHGYAFFGCM
jgi:hypothetical protein